MAQDGKITLYALDCGTVNWRLYRMEYHFDSGQAKHVTSPLSSPLANFSDQKLPAVITLTEDGIDVQSIGETALAYLEDTQARFRVREFFKPSIGSHLVDDPSPHQQRYSHFEALLFTRLLLKSLIDQIREEKYSSDPFDAGIHFSVVYPDNWRTEHDGRVFEDFYHVVLECYPSEIGDQIHFVPESEGVFLGLKDQGLLEKFHSEDINLILDMGGSHTTFYARKYNAETGVLKDISSYTEPFGGGLYDALMAKHISSELKIPTSELNKDSSAFMSLRIWGQLIKEKLSRQAAGVELPSEPQQTVTLVMNNKQVYRKNIELTPKEFLKIIKPLDDAFQELVTRALDKMGIDEEFVGRVILLGGGVLLPGISGGITKRFGKYKVMIPENPEEVIVRGAGLSFTSALPEREAQQRKHVPERKSGWRLIYSDGSVFDVNKEITIVGRSAEADISLDSKSCSRTHALLRLEGNELTLLDLRSKNGTFVNQTQLAPHSPHYLRAGDRIRFGDQSFSLK